MRTSFILNKKEVTIERPKGMVLLDVIREEFQLKGTKAGCREGDCGSCIVLAGRIIGGAMSYRTVNSCLFPLGQAEGAHIVTIEGLKQERLNLIQQQFIEEKASQCGFCTPGFIVSLVGYFLQSAEPNEQDAISYLSGNICRCTGYGSVIRAVNSILNLVNTADLAPVNTDERLRQLVAAQILPEYFLSIPSRLHGSALLNQIGPQPQTHEPVVAGGTDLYVHNSEELSEAEPYFILPYSESNGIILDDVFCHIPASTTVTDFFRSPLIRLQIPGIEEYEPLIASPSIRNRATIGGNIINASPIGDMSIILLSLGAVATLGNEQKKRNIPLKELFISYKNLDIQEGELLISIAIPNIKRSFHFEKISKRRHLDIASVNMAISSNISEANGQTTGIAAGGVAPIPLYLSKTSEMLSDRSAKKQSMHEILSTAMGEISPISDIRGSADYKKLLFRQLLSIAAEKISFH